YTLPLHDALPISLGEIDADQSARIRGQQRTAESGAAAGIEHIELPRRLEARLFEHARQQSRCPTRPPHTRASAAGAGPDFSTMPATSAGARYDNCSSFDSKLEAKLSN